MSAKELTVFAPDSVFSEHVFNEVVRGLSLVVDVVPPTLNLSYQFSAKKGVERNHDDVIFLGWGFTNRR